MRLVLVAALAFFLAHGVIPSGGSASARAAEPKYPRFVSLRAGKAYVRTGPGRRYPIAWVFVRSSVPVQIVGAFETWRRIRDWEGTEGWIHQSLLSSRSSIIVLDGPERLYRAPDPSSPLVARVERRAIGRPIECRPAWCRVEFSGLRGWIKKAAIWGVGAAYPKTP